MEDKYNIRIIQKLLGHNDIRTTQCYMIVNEKDLQKAKNPLASLYESKKNTVDADIEKNT